MSELVITHRIPSSITPLGDWLADIADQVTLITSSDAHDGYRHAFPRVFAVPDYPFNPAVEGLLAEVCRQRRPARLVHVTEDDILRCATIRDRFEIPGLSYDDAVPWRDKYVMKRRVQAAGIATPEFCAPRHLDDAERFAGRVGYPVVAKPRLGFGSLGVEIVADRAALSRLAGRWDATDILLEEYTPGAVYHVDGFMHRGGVLYVSVSRYLNDCLAFRDSRPLGSFQLDRDSATFAAFDRLARRVVAALPTVEFSPFHLEVFRRPDTGQLVFCEVACRLGGAHIMETLTYATGINPAALWIRHQAGLEDGTRRVLHDQSTRYGWLLIPPRPGRLVAVDPPEPRPYIKDFIVKTAVPRTFDGAQSSTDSYLAFVVDGADSAAVETNLRACITLADQLARWEPNDVAAV
jgi:ATP-grasp domain-containing protein